MEYVSALSGLRACLNGNYKCVLSLLQNDADTTVLDQDGHNAMYYPHMSEHHGIVAALTLENLLRNTLNDDAKLVLAVLVWMTSIGIPEPTQDFLFEITVYKT